MSVKTRYTTTLFGILLFCILESLFAACSFTPPLLPDDCFTAQQTDLVRIDDVLFGPLRQERWLTSADTVSAQQLFLNLAFGFALDAVEDEEVVNPLTASLFSRHVADALSRSLANEIGYFFLQDNRRLDCSPIFQVQNVSNIRIFLLSPFEDLQIGDDISFLFVRNDGSTVQRWRDFSRTSRFNQLRLTRIPSTPARLQLRFEVFTTTGESFEWAGITPVILP
ncbi:MAG: hypothetical protein ACXIT9_11630 [Nitritalea sp.]